MALEVYSIKKPFEVSFTGNPIPFQFIIAPFGNSERGQNISLSIKIFVEEIFMSNSFSEVKYQSFNPDQAGKIQLDIRSILDAYVSYFTPPINLKKPVIAPKQSCRYKISYQLQQNNSTITDVVYSDIYFAVKGGLAYEQWHYKEFFTEIVLNQKLPLNFFTDSENIGFDSNGYLFWLYGKDESIALTVKFTVYSNLGNVYTKTIATTVSPVKWQVCCIAVGYNNHNLFSLLAVNELAVKYAVEVVSGSETIVTKQYFTIDHRTYYDAKQLIYRNSVGALEQVWLRGQIDVEYDDARQTALQISPPAYFDNTILMAQSVTYNVEETERFIADTGFISKNNLDKLRDLLLSKDVMVVEDGKLIPIIINTKNSKFYSNKSNLFALQIEFIKAFINNFYTPKNLMPQTRVCPGVDVLEVKQISKNVLRIMYSLPIPYDLVEIEITIGTSVTIYTYKGNCGVYNQTIVNPATTTPVLVIIKARVVCDAFANDKGPQTTKNVYVTGNSAPVANDDTYNIASGYNSAITLPGSVLSNDYDPDGDAIAVIPSFGATHSGGSYSINALGIVTYTPPSSTYSGTDFFSYSIQEVGGAGLTATAKCYILVGSSVSAVFAKIVYTNQTSSGGSDGNSFSYADIWIYFYSNPQGTAALDITSLGLTINYRKRTSFTDSGGTVTTDTDSSITGTGDKVFLGNFTTFATIVDVSNESTTFLMLPGTGYSAI